MFVLQSYAMGESSYSVAGLFPVPQQGREVWNFNPAWRFHLGDVKGAEAKVFDDSRWQIVSTPHCVKLEPAESSGGRNYQGVAWYRKHFVVPAARCEVYFEAAMGKQQVYVNGKLALKHEGGYLPFAVNLGDMGLSKGDSCVIAVKVDNSDDKTYPPGKRQMTLDFSYHGGIYRDVWLIAKNEVHITDAVLAGHQAAGGVFVHYSDISERSAQVLVNTEVSNSGRQSRTVNVEQTLMDARGRRVKSVSQKLVLAPGETRVAQQSMTVSRPHLWSPEQPYLYHLVTRVKQGRTTLDAGMTRVGIRSFEFKGSEGFWLNGKRYRQFVGANRHQDFAYVGNALPNSQQWRDALRLKQAGFNIIRTAHYPQDPSFMEACDSLGLFIIVATPGWQYWNSDPSFEQKVLENTRQIIRRDRNHPCVLMWEPILNETRFPESFALKSLQVTRDEYPYPYRPAAVADEHSAGVRDHYDVVYGWPGDDERADRPKQCIFTREFGEYVDDWYAHNAINRSCRAWGERPMLVQALSLCQTASTMWRTNGQFIGGCQWHPFDHQRGYHPDSYFGGIYDAFRQKKTAFYMFASQRHIDTLSAFPASRVEPMVYIANEMTQFSDSDVVVFSNCDSVRLRILNNSRSITLPVPHPVSREFNGPVVFRGAWNFWDARELSYKQKSPQKVDLVAEGIVGGKVVCRERKQPSRRSTRLRLYADTMGRDLVADGSDFIVVVAEVTDDSGHVRRLAREQVRFTVTGEGSIIDDGQINANPRLVEWGSAPILLRSTRRAGTIKVHAEVQFPGVHAPKAADLELQSVPYDGRFCFLPSEDEATRKLHSSDSETNLHQPQMTDEERARMLQEVERQQTEFGVQNQP
jgi:beta-galactosidase